MVEQSKNGAGRPKNPVQPDIQEERRAPAEKSAYVSRMNSAPPEKKCFVKIVAIGDSGVGKTSVI